MGDLEFPTRLYTKGREPMPDKSINYHSRMHVLPHLRKALQKDEWDHLRNSPLGVFIKFYEMKFGWGSRKVHWLLTLQLQCKQENEIWCLIGSQPIRFSLLEFQHLTGLNCEYLKRLEEPQIKVTKAMTKFWENLLRVPIHQGPSVKELIVACQGDCSSWTREERIRLGYLCLYASFIDVHDPRTATRVGMARLVMDLDAFENYPWGRVAFKKLISSVKDVDLSKSVYTS